MVVNTVDLYWRKNMASLSDNRISLFVHMQRVQYDDKEFELVYDINTR